MRSKSNAVLYSTDKRLKERFKLDETGQNVQIFEEVLFLSYVQHKNRKQTMNATYLVPVR